MTLNEKYKRLLKLLEILTLKLKKLLGKKVTIPSFKKPKSIVLHHTGGDWSFEQVNRHHKQKWGFKSSLGYYIGYHYWFDYDGESIQARRDTEEAAHCVEPGNPGYWNNNSIGPVCRGNYDKRKVSKKLSKKLKKKLDKLRKKYNIPKTEIYGHGQIKNTKCPGKNLMSWLEKYKSINHGN